MQVIVRAIIRNLPAYEQHTILKTKPRCINRLANTNLARSRGNQKLRTNVITADQFHERIHSYII